jgi:DNA modification methylase
VRQPREISNQAPALGAFEVETLPLESLQPAAYNPRKIRKRNLEALARELREFGLVEPIVANRRPSGELVIVGGHQRLEAARAIGWPAVPVHVIGVSLEREKALNLALNNPALQGEWDEDKLRSLLSELPQLEAGLAGFEAGLLAEPQIPGPTLADRFGVPPFSVLDARQGYWQDRKRAWLSLGIKSELGRGENLLNFSDAARGKVKYEKSGGALAAYSDGSGPVKYAREQTASLKGGKTFGLTMHPYDGTDPGTTASYTGTSIFDPVLCELAYRWFCPPGGQVLDPFAGGSVRGIVAARLGRAYVGIDLSAAQVQANRDQLGAALDPAPRWVVGDSRDAGELAPGAYDLIFSSPPYGDLEVYSTHPKDLSAMKAPEFRSAYRECVAAACALLKPDRFACFVVGDYREKGARGIYRNFVSETISAFQAAGLELYNEAILVTAVGSLPIRTARNFESARKLGKTHQNVLVFVKGDPKKATHAIGPVDFARALPGETA